VFEEEGALDQLEAFASINGPRFYSLPLNTGTLTLNRAPVTAPAKLAIAGTELVPFHAEETLGWSFTGINEA